MSDRPLDYEPKTAEEIEAERAPDNAANELAVKERKTNQRSLAQLRQNALRTVLASKEGRHLLRHILFGYCGLHSISANAAYDPNGLHFKEGARNVGLLLLKDCEVVDPVQLSVLMSEQLQGLD